MGRGPFYTKSELLIIQKRHQAGVKPKAIAKELKRPYEGLAYKMQKMGLRQGKKPMTLSVSMSYDHFLLISELAQQSGMSKSAYLYAIVKKNLEDIAPHR